MSPCLGKSAVMQTFAVFYLTRHGFAGCAAGSEGVVQQQHELRAGVTAQGLPYPTVSGESLLA